MIYSESSLARRVFSRFLPPWASRVGYFDGLPSPESFVPPHIFPIPLSVAPAATLDGVWMDSAHAVTTVHDLATTLACLGPGGVGALFLSSRFWKRGQIDRFCTGAGMQVLFFSAVPSKGKIRLNQRGLPIPRNPLRRMLLGVGTLFFPGLAFLFGAEWFVILQKGSVRSRETDGLRLSVVVPLPADRDRARNRLHEWEKFLSDHRMHDVQLVAVDEAEGDPLEGKSGSTIRVHHYRRFGRSHAIRSALLSARGKMVLLDSDRQLPPSLLFDLLNERLRESQAADVISGYDSARQPVFTSRLLYRMISGLSRPQPLFVLLSDRAARAVLDLHPEQLNGYAFAIPLHLRRQRLTIREVALHPDPPAPPAPGGNPSLTAYLFYRLRRGAVYLSLALWLPFAPQLVDAGIEKGMATWQGASPSLASLPSFSLGGAGRAIGERMADYQAVLLGYVRIAHDEFPVAFDSAYSAVVVASRYTSGFFFVLGLAILLHFHNSVFVYRLSSGRRLTFLVALAEAGMAYALKNGLEGWQSGLLGPFAAETALRLAFPAFLALILSRLFFFPAYALLFRRQ